MAGTSSPAEHFKFHEIAPDILDTIPNNMQQLDVEYEGGVKVEFGGILNRAAVEKQPKLSWEADQDALYTVIMSDPDPPTRKWAIFREAKHWLVVNIPGSDLSGGQVVAEYGGAMPPPLTGLHRYVFLIFKQSRRIDDAEYKTEKAKGRPRFKTRKFIEDYALQGPVAGNLFQRGFDGGVRDQLCTSQLQLNL